MKFIKVDVLKDNLFTFDFSELSAYYNQKEDIVWIDSITDDQMYQAPFDYINAINVNPEIDNVMGRRITLEFSSNCNYADSMDLLLLKKFHYTWFNELRHFLRTDDFKKILIEVEFKRRKTTIFPQKSLVFSEFLTNLKNIKGVWVGESPYPNKHANGRAFASWEKSTPKSLEILLNGIKRDLGLRKIDINNDLSHFTNKGIMLLNYSLTIGKNKELLNIWLPFIKEVIKVLNKKEKISAIFFGVNAKSLVHLFKDSFNMWETSHPISASYSDSEWGTKNVFKIFNLNLNLGLCGSNTKV